MKVQTKYICQSCGYESPRWIGKCPNCSQWNTFQEEVAEKVSARKTVKQTQLQAVPLDEIIIDEGQRIQTTNSEFDRVLGGGIVLGSVILLGGDPGVGKSTLMMQLAGQLQNYVVLYISGEESAKQIK
ncbi:MAG: DNA repair protein RadA, partial [Ignavibacteriae bacterium]|nr:DNA repair protein RadA [Ignavibacteriota bacterium]